MLADSSKPIANPFAVLREEFDDWAVLFDPDLDTGFGLDSVGVFIWKHLDGRNTVRDIVSDLRVSCENVPEEANDIVRGYIQSLVEKGLAGYEIQRKLELKNKEPDEERLNKRIEWSIPVLMELGHGALSNIAAFALGDAGTNAGGGCGCTCETGPDAIDACISGGIVNTGCGGGS